MAARRTVSRLPLNIDPKLATAVVTSGVVYALTTWLGLDVSDELRAAISVGVAGFVGYRVPPADTVST